MLLLRILLLFLAAGLAQASPVQFVVVNSTRSAITSIQVRPSGGPYRWSRELLLKGRALPPGAGDPYLQIDDENGALWDVKLTTEDGDFTFLVLNLSKTPILTLAHFAESGLWILSPDRPEQPLPDMEESAEALWPDLWEDDEPEEAP